MYSGFDLKHTDLAHIICYGQSLSNGSDAPAYTDDIVENVFVYGGIDDPFCNSGLSPLQLKKDFQQPIATACNVLSMLLADKFSHTVGIVAGSYGAGGQSIAQLMSKQRQEQIKSEEGYTYDCVSRGRYNLFERAVDNLFEYASNNSKTVICPAIVFLQGERDYFNDLDLGFTLQQPGSNSAAYSVGGNKEKYKKYMLRIKEDMQSKVMSTYNQSEKPLFFIYQTSGVFVKNAEATINNAQLEFAMENDDVVLVQAPYFTPKYNSGHLTVNGYRWLGEYIGKYIFEALTTDDKPYPLIPTSISINEDNTIQILLNRAEDGLTIDDYTMLDASNSNNKYGFTVYANDEKHVPLKVQVFEKKILLNMDSKFAKIPKGKKVKVIYAGQDAEGMGNIRDNSSYEAFYRYLNDSSDNGLSGTLKISYSAKNKDGKSLIGEKYPMYNWLASFTYEIKKP